jgi:hypothetical protein
MTLQAVAAGRASSAAPVSSKVRRTDRKRAERLLTTPTAQLWVEADGIVRCALRTCASENLRTAYDNLGALSELCCGQRVRILVDLRMAGEITREALALWWSTAVDHLVASVALLVERECGLPTGLIFLSLPRSRMPVRWFSTEGEALDWLGTTPS